MNKFIFITLGFCVYLKINKHLEMAKAYIFLAEGFEITEAMAPADILRRGGVDLNIVSIGDSLNVRSAQGISVTADTIIDGTILYNISTSDIMIFPGGMPGTIHLAECRPLIKKMQDHFSMGGTVAAICAAPGLVLSLLPLDRLSAEKGKIRMTCYEGFEHDLIAKGVSVADPRTGVVEDGNIISSSGAGHAIDFGLRILARIKGPEIAGEVRKSIML